MLQDSIVVCINFQRYSDDEIAKYVSYATAVGLEVHFRKSDYVYASSTIVTREDTHQLADCPFGLNFDDDIELLSETYIDALQASLQFLHEHDDAGSISIVSQSMHAPCQIRYANNTAVIQTDGGIMYRALPTGRMYDEAYYGLLGCAQDRLLVMNRLALGFKHYRCYAGKCYKHYALVGQPRLVGRKRHGWQGQPQQILAECRRLQSMLVTK